jgi:hypothetical protein
VKVTAYPLKVDFGYESDACAGVPNKQSRGRLAKGS